MTLDEFIDALSKTPRDWEVRAPDKAIRNAKCKCPIEGVQCGAGEIAVWSEYRNVGLSRIVALSIMRAADADTGHSPALRARLLTACGLTE